jgi:hypothetical protein
VTKSLVWKRALASAGLVSLAVGLVRSYQVYSFLQTAEKVPATVIAVEHPPGPPKPRRTIPVHLRYKLSTGEEVQSVTTLPLLQSLKEGDVVTVLAGPAGRQEVRFPLLSELFAVPLTFLVLGVLGLIIGSLGIISSKLQKTAA